MCLCFWQSGGVVCTARCTQLLCLWRRCLSVGLYVMCQIMARNVAVCVLAFPDEVDHLIYLFLLVVEVQRLHTTLEVGRGETFCPANTRIIIRYLSIGMYIFKSSNYC